MVYLSRRLNRQQKIFATVEKECLAIKCMPSSITCLATKAFKSMVEHRGGNAEDSEDALSCANFLLETVAQLQRLEQREGYVT